jgi:hypothetical protein
MKHFICALFITLTLLFKANAEEPSIETTIGDGSNVEIFSFIKDFLLKEPKLSKTKATNLEQKEHDKMENSNEEHQPLSAMICENELAQLIFILCERKQWCENITLYQTNGVAVLSSCFRNEAINSFNFASARPEDLKLGIINLETAKPPKFISYQDEKGEQFTEYLKEIYYNKVDDYAYIDNGPRDPSDKRIGYISYISNNKIGN